jgi:hypothetical protein
MQGRPKKAWGTRFGGKNQVNPDSDLQSVSQDLTGEIEILHDSVSD